MKRNGFTLIELLAVIVILAIIALIATPIILGIINDAREKANESSVELYASAVRNAVAAYQLTNANAPTSFSDLNVQYDGKVECIVEELYADGSFYLEGCKVNNGEKEYSYGTKQGNDVAKACTLDDKDGDGIASLSDVVTCGTESFYVMYNENTEIAMLSMYNLYVANSMDSENYEQIPLEKPTNKQSEISKGYVEGDSIWYGTVPFSNTDYWIDENGNLLSQYGSSFPTRVYNQNSNLYEYVSEYERILKEDLKVNSVSASLISYEQLKKLGCSDDSESCENAPSWVYSTSYWQGSAIYDSRVWNVSSSGDFHAGVYDVGYGVGVRPVITISTSELK